MWEAVSRDAGSLRGRKLWVSRRVRNEPGERGQVYTPPRVNRVGGWREKENLKGGRYDQRTGPFWLKEVAVVLASPFRFSSFPTHHSLVDGSSSELEHVRALLAASIWKGQGIWGAAPFWE